MVSSIDWYTVEAIMLVMEYLESGGNATVKVVLSVVSLLSDR